jgi:hypothetical protein
VLRMGEERDVRKFAMHGHKLRREGPIYMDAPRHGSLSELIEMGRARRRGKRFEKAIHVSCKLVSKPLGGVINCTTASGPRRPS